MKKLPILVISSLLIIAAVGFFWLRNINSFKRVGTFEINANERPIKILRDENGIAYVLAENKADAIRGQGFVLAQDRLFQIEFYRTLIKGEAAKLVGGSMLQSDIKMRVLNLYGNAERHFQFLDDAEKALLNWYCQGYNAYLEAAEDEFPVELGLLGITPSSLKPVDIVSVTHFIGLFHSQNMDDEILSLNLSSRMKNAAELLPLSINLDRTKPLRFDSMINSPNLASEPIALNHPALPNPLLPYPELGSNNWAISGAKSESGKPILANDPHVDARVLPGTFYPVGLICPEFKAVGIATPGIPGLISGRNAFVSFGVTNAYGDSQDLFIEEADGDHYLENGNRMPFKMRDEVIEVKDSSNVEIEVRSTVRGPVISDFPIFGILTGDVVSLRWSLAETESNSVGFADLLETKNVSSFRRALTKMDNMFFNFVFADIEGNIAHQATGLVPVRLSRNGELPQPGNQGDRWNGFIPKSEMPHMINPPRGWVGTANHDTRADDYPYYYSNHFSPYYRYQRLSEVFSTEEKLVATDLWQLIFDVKNMQAEKLVPVFSEALEADPRTQKLASIIDAWNRQDDINEVGAAIYTVLYNELLYLLLNDELPDELEESYWENVYYWNQRLDSLMLSGHRFIDNVDTPEKETLSGLIVQAGVRTEELLRERFGEDEKDWTWGRLHTVYFYSPIRRTGFGSELLGAELLPKQGSNQTINRGGFIKREDHVYETSWFSSFRMVADMGDDEKIMGVVSGGSASRIFHPYYKSQLEQWKTGTWIPYWLSQEKVLEHAQFELVLE